MYKVFINDKPLYLFSEKKIPDSLPEKMLKLEYKSEKEIHAALDLLSAGDNFSGGMIFSENVEHLWKKFTEQFKIVEAAGGLVLNKKKELLMIYRFERWDLPKGKIEKNEEPATAALREVCEETGVCDCEITGELTSTYHIYTYKEKKILKKTFWFEMKCKSFNGFRVQEEEGIMEARWMSKKELSNAMENTYPSLIELINAVPKRS